MSAKAGDQQGDMDRTLAFQIVQFLQAFKEKNEGSADQIDSACQSIESVFGINASSSDDFRGLSFFPTGLADLVESGIEATGAAKYGENEQEMADHAKFQAFLKTVSDRGYFKGAEPDSIEYLKRHAKVISKFKAKYHSADSPSKSGASAAPSGSTAGAGDSSEAKEKLAEEKKAAGNVAIGKKNYEEAVNLYSEAVALCPKGRNSHIYYCNRAAAYCHLNNYQLAATDCESALALNASYVKAYSRLGLSRFFLQQYEAAVAAYQRAVELEPGTKSHMDSLKQAQQKLAEEKNKKSPTSAATAAPNPMGGAGGGGMPDLSALAGMMGGAGGGGMPDLSALAGMMGGAGGGGGLGGMLQNPAMMQMAQQMMSDPNMMAQAQQMMSDPNMMAQAQQMMQNPAMMAQMQQMMGGAGGGGGMPDLSALAGMMGGGGGGSGSGGVNQMPSSFSGFAEEEDGPAGN